MAEGRGATTSLQHELAVRATAACTSAVLCRGRCPNDDGADPASCSPPAVSLRPIPCSGVGPMDGAATVRNHRGRVFSPPLRHPARSRAGASSHRLLAPASLQNTRPLRSSAVLRPTRFGSAAPSINGPPSQEIGSGDTAGGPHDASHRLRHSPARRLVQGASSGHSPIRADIEIVLNRTKSAESAARLPRRHRRCRDRRGVAAHQPGRRCLRLVELGRAGIRRAQALCQSRTGSRTG